MEFGNEAVDNPYKDIKKDQKRGMPKNFQKVDQKSSVFETKHIRNVREMAKLELKDNFKGTITQRVIDF